MFFVCPMFSKVCLKLQGDVFMYYIAPYCPSCVVKVYRKIKVFTFKECHIQPAIKCNFCPCYSIIKESLEILKWNTTNRLNSMTRKGKRGIACKYWTNFVDLVLCLTPQPSFRNRSELCCKLDSCLFSLVSFFDVQFAYIYGASNRH